MTVMKMTKLSKKSDEKEEVCDVAGILEKFGKYQVMQFTLLCFPAIFINMVNINYIFTAGDVNYRCKIPECESSIATYNVSWWPDVSIDRCSRPVLRADHVPGAVCTNLSFTRDLVPCQEWVYESNDTIVGELNLACREWQSKLIGTAHNAGMLLSRLVGGWMSDRFGRKPTLVFCAVSAWVGQLKTLATSYYMYISIELIEAALTGGVYGAAVMLMLEICGRKQRIMSGVIFSCCMYLGECLFAIIAMFVPYWKTLIHIINAPSVLFLTYIFLVRESPRWLIISGNTERAKETMLTVAEMNKIKIDKKELSELDTAKLKSKFNIGANEKRETLMRILSSKEIMKRVLVAVVCRFTVSFVYYGLMINSVYLPGNKYTNFLLVTVMSFPGELISLYFMNKIGRRLPLLVGFLIAGTLCVATGYIPTTYKWAKIMVFLIGKMVISMCFTGIITYTMELFPTSARGSLLGFVAFAGRVGGMLAPLTPILNPISEALPSILFGCSALISGILVTLTPETKHLPLMDTINQVEESVKNKSLKTEPLEVPPVDYVTHL